MAGRRIGKYLEVEGGLFAVNMKPRFNDAMSEGIQDVAELGEEIMVSFISAAGFIDTGDFVSSVETTYKRRSDHVIGYAEIAPRAVFPKPDRPTQTWLQDGVRKGQKLRKGYNVAGRTATRIRAFSYETVAAKVAAVLR